LAIINYQLATLISYKLNHPHPMLRLIFTIAICLSALQISLSQKDFYKNYPFTKADTLRGMMRPERAVFDVTFYELNIKVDPGARTVSGYVDIAFNAVQSFKSLQLDLYVNMNIERIEHRGRDMNYHRVANAVFVDLLPGFNKGEKGRFRVYYTGQPQFAKNAPWDGGFVWSTDANGRPWIGVACEGDGASLWWPCKDHLSDEPDSMAIKVAVPDTLVCVANGDLRQKSPADPGYTRWDWQVTYPINNYNVTVNIGDYAHFSDTYVAGDHDSLRMDFYVLSYNLEKAKVHFEQTHKMFACFERYFGKYPFWRDGYALVETPYLGMEHQSAVAYGNKYQRGYMGGMIPRDMNWDYLIIHETGHEWWGNSISCSDLAEMWIHESFTTYMEALYVECAYSYADALRYLKGQRMMILNREPIIGPKGVNFHKWRGSDHYFKGSWFLHTLRHAINDDAVWFDLLKSFYNRYAYSTITTADFLKWVNQCTHRDWSRVFEQYLEYPGIPIFEYQILEAKKATTLRYRWKTDVKGFDMPMLIEKKGTFVKILPTSEWKELKLSGVAPGDIRMPEEFFLAKISKVKE
jgi:aminopeptidase N